MSRTTQALKESVKQLLEVDLTDEQLTDGTAFKDLDIDSLDTIEVLITVEDKLDIQLDDARLEKLQNISELVQYLREFD